jgi:hypothetical protein
LALLVMECQPGWQRALEDLAELHGMVQVRPLQVRALATLGLAAYRVVGGILRQTAG